MIIAERITDKGWPFPDLTRPSILSFSFLVASWDGKRDQDLISPVKLTQHHRLFLPDTLESIYPPKCRLTELPSPAQAEAQPLSSRSSGRHYAGKYGAVSELARTLMHSVGWDGSADSGRVWNNWQDVTEAENAG